MNPGATWKRLGDVALINPRRPPLSRSADAPTSFVPMQAVDERRGEIAEAEVRLYSEVAKGYTYFEEGDVLFAKITPCMQNGKHAVARGLIDGIGFGSTEFHVVRPSSELLSEWVHFYLRAHAVLAAAERTFTGSVGQQRVPDEFLADLRVPVPPLEEQRLRLRFLQTALSESLDASGALGEQIGAARRLLSALLHESLGTKSPVTVGEAQPAKDFWPSQPLLALARLESGHTPSRRRPEWWGGPIPWLALPDIRRLHGKFAYETLETTNAAGLANSSARLLPVGTVCVSRTASIGFVTILGRPMATSQDFCNWICDPERLDPEFLMYAFMASQDHLRELGSGAVHKTIYMPTIQSFHICAPPIEEQRRIARRLRERLAAAEELTTGLRARLAEIELLPQRILASAFGTPA